MHKGSAPEFCCCADPVLVRPRPQAAEGHDEVVTRDLGASGRAGRGGRVASQRVNADPVSKRQLLRGQGSLPLAEVGDGALGGSAKPGLLEGVKVCVVLTWWGRAGRHGRIEIDDRAQ